jgi:DMSO/TMAO reductase YedYZ molybdopterin-dependent catalytic subunit
VRALLHSGAAATNPRGVLHRTNIVVIDTDTQRTGLGTLVGLLTAAVAIGVAQLVAGITGANSWPVVAVGQLSIDFTPPAVKDFAITAFGSNDKLVLLSGIAVVLTIFAAVIGVLAVRRLEYGLTGLVIFAAIGILAAVTRPNASASAALPTLIGAAAGAGAMVLMLRAAGAMGPSVTAVGAGAGPDGAASSGPAARQPPGGRPDSQPPVGRPGWTPPASRPPSSATGGHPEWAAPATRAGSRGAASGTAGAGVPERRRFLVTSGAAAGTAAVAYLGGRLLSERSSVAEAQRTLRIPRPFQSAPPLPAGADLKIPGLSSFITPNNSFYRVDTAIVLPEVDPAGWQLRIHGMVRREMTISFGELIRRPLIEDYVTLTCVSNPVAGTFAGNAKWLGASLTSLLRQAGVRAGADQLLCTSADGFTSGAPLLTAMDGRDAMLAVAMNGTVLPVEHGFPVRMVIPGLYGYVSACKWIVDIEVTTFAANTAYWAQRGWDQQAPIKTESRIDVPSGQNSIRAGRTSVAGVAWAQHKGIAAVEVRIDRGPWQQARLAQVPGIDSWRQWVWEWDAEPGNHLIEARATDKTGYTQTSAQAPPEPNGATGYPAVQVNVVTA